MEIEKVDTNNAVTWRGIAGGFGLITAVLAIVGFCMGIAHGAQIVDWSRVTGKVVKIDQRANVLTIVYDGFPLTIKLDQDASIVVGKEVRALKDVSLGDKIAVVNMPPAPKPKDSDEPPLGGVYK